MEVNIRITGLTYAPPRAVASYSQNYYQIVTIIKLSEPLARH